MNEVATLLIRVQSDQADAAKAKLASLGLQAEKTEKATSGLTKAWNGFAVLLASTVSIGTALAGLSKLVDTAKRFESLEAQLKTATGSAENAAKAFQALQQFATETPYDLAQTVDAFIKLVNLGLEPSERALRSYGNTASAMGQTLEEMTLAVSNATQGTFITLRKFGVQARTEAEGIRFSFRGASELVKNDAQHIEDYFIRLGEKNFAGAMQDRMATLEGKLSNLGDAWDVLFATIAKSGAGDLIKNAVDIAIASIQELTDALASGELIANIDAIASKFKGLGKDISEGLNAATDSILETFKATGTAGSSTVDFIINAFKQLPENLHAVINAVGATFGMMYGQSEATIIGVQTLFKAGFDSIAEQAKALGQIIVAAMNPLLTISEKWDAVKAGFKRGDDAQKEFGVNAQAIFKNTVIAISNVAEAWDTSITATLDERDAALASFDAKIKKAKELRTEYDKNNAAQAAGAKGTDRLAGFKVNAGGATAEFEELKKKLRTEQQVLVDDYNKRKQIIVDNTKQDAKGQAELLAQLKDNYTEQRKALLDKAGLDVQVTGDAAQDALAIELATLNDGYDTKKRILDDALKAKLVSEEEYSRRVVQLDKTTALQRAEIDRASNNARLELAAGFAGNLATIAGAFGAKGAKIAKAAAIVQTTIKTYESATSAYASLAGIPYIGPALGAAAAAAAIAAGLVNIAKIKSQDYSGAYAEGGFIPAGKYGITQEAGYEVTHGPTAVTSARATADSRGASSASPVVVNLINQSGVELEAQQGSTSADGKKIDLIVKRVKRELASDVRTGGNSFSGALENTYGVNRGNAA